MEYIRHKNRELYLWLTAPFIWAVCIPLLLLDLVISIYHRICFPIYGIPLVRRGDYIIFDRHRLEYLSFWQKIFCTYCAYANGLLPYCVEIAARTEKFWCGIMHQKGSKGQVENAHQKDFLPYGDKKAYLEEYGEDIKKWK